MTKALTQKQVTSAVGVRIEQMRQEDGLRIAPNYSVSNALSSAYYELKNNNLLMASPDSIYNALLDMVTQGLSPAKKQCYFIQYGSEVKLNRSYFGTMKVVKQLPEVKDIWAEVIYEGDSFKIKNVDGKKVLEAHETDWLNADNPIMGAYCIIEKVDGEKILTVMTKKEIDKSWSKARTKNVQNDFPQEMAKRTVINRAAKQFFNTSDDNDLFVDAINRTTQEEFERDSSPRDVTADEEPRKSLADILGRTRSPEAVKETTEAEHPAEADHTEPKAAEEQVDLSKEPQDAEELAEVGEQAEAGAEREGENSRRYIDQETGEITLLDGQTTAVTDFN